MTKLAEDAINSLRVKYARYLHLSANVLDDDEYLIGVYDGKNACNTRSYSSYKNDG